MKLPEHSPKSIHNGDKSLLEQLVAIPAEPTEDVKCQNAILASLEELLRRSSISHDEYRKYTPTIETLNKLRGIISDLIISLGKYYSEDENNKISIAHYAVLLHHVYEYILHSNKMKSLLKRDVPLDMVDNHMELVNFNILGFVYIKHHGVSLDDLLSPEEISHRAVVEFIVSLLDIEESVDVSETYPRLATRYPKIAERNIGIFILIKYGIFGTFISPQLGKEISDLLQKEKIFLNAQKVLPGFNKFSDGVNYIEEVALTKFCSNTEEGTILRNSIAPLTKERLSSLIFLLGVKSMEGIPHLYNRVVVASRNNEIPESQRQILSDFADGLLQIVEEDFTYFKTAATIQKLLIDESFLKNDVFTEDDYFEKIKMFQRRTLTQTKQREWVFVCRHESFEYEGFIIPSGVTVSALPENCIEGYFVYDLEDDQFVVSFYFNTKAQTLSWSVFEGPDTPLLSHYFYSLLRMFKYSLVKISEEVTAEQQAKRNLKLDRYRLDRPTQARKAAVHVSHVETNNSSTTANMDLVVPLDFEVETTKEKVIGIQSVLLFNQQEVRGILEENGIHDQHIQKQIINILRQRAQGSRPFCPYYIETLIHEAKPVYSCRAGKKYRALLYLDESASKKEERKYRIFKIDDRGDAYDY